MPITPGQSHKKNQPVFGGLIFQYSIGQILLLFFSSFIINSILGNSRQFDVGIFFFF
jgi:hypothetical protein